MEIWQGVLFVGIGILFVIFSDRRRDKAYKNYLKRKRGIK